MGYILTSSLCALIMVNFYKVSLCIFNWRDRSNALNHEISLFNNIIYITYTLKFHCIYLIDQTGQMLWIMKSDCSMILYNYIHFYKVSLYIFNWPDRSNALNHEISLFNDIIYINFYKVSVFVFNWPERSNALNHEIGLLNEEKIMTMSMLTSHQQSNCMYTKSNFSIIF